MNLPKERAWYCWTCRDWYVQESMHYIMNHPLKTTERGVLAKPAQEFVDDPRGQTELGKWISK